MDPGEARPRARGRPRLDAIQQRRHLIAVRLTTAEASDVAQAAKRHEVRPAKFARDAVLAAIDRSPGPPAPTARELAALERSERNRELRRIGVNTNQIARRINSSWSADGPTRDALLEVRDALRQVEQRLAKELAK